MFQLGLHVNIKTICKAWKNCKSLVKQFIEKYLDNYNPKI